MKLRLAPLVVLLIPMRVDAASIAMPDLTGTWLGLTALAIFALAYVFVITEEFTELRKSKPLLVAAGLTWLLVAIAYQNSHIAGAADLLRHNLLEFAELLLFLVAAMTYVNTMQERNLFAALRAWLIARGLSLRQLFWTTGALAFVLSPMLDNLTTALVMGAVVVAVGRANQEFIAPACINIVVAANAGGAFSPFGDITTLMVWQAGLLGFLDFFALFVPSLVNWLLPAICMAWVIAKERPRADQETAQVKPGGYVVAALFAATIVMTIALHQFAHLPPFLGMMTGLGLLQLYGYLLRHRELRTEVGTPIGGATGPDWKPATKPFDIFISMKRVEWDTLMFFYGVILCVGALAAFGYLSTLSQLSYVAFGPSIANILVGIASAIVDNIPIMFAVLSIEPTMSDGQWLLVTLTAGVGGSLLSIGSAAGVALMGQARGIYTFASHLKWSWAIALGYAASIAAHFIVNASRF